MRIASANFTAAGAREQKIRFSDAGSSRVRLAFMIMVTTLLTIGAGPGLRGQAADQPGDTSPSTIWQYGGFVDAGYLHDFNEPANHLFRSRGTTFHVNEVNLNMAAVYLRKAASESSRWGLEATVQAGDDSLIFGFSATAPDLDGARQLRHLGPTDVSYLAPVGKGLTLQGGIFSSFIGYDSLYAKDNFNYTRPWGADFTPYLMMGVNAQYPFTAKLTGALFVINDYFHLALKGDASVRAAPVKHRVAVLAFLFRQHRRVETGPGDNCLRVSGCRRESGNFWKSASPVDVGPVTDALVIRQALERDG